MRTGNLLLTLILFCCHSLVSAQNARLALLPDEVRVKNASLVVERQNLMVVSDGNYTVPDSGRIFVLPETSVPRTLTLPPASTYPLRQIIILDKTSGVNRWTIAGGFVTRTNVGLPPFNTENNVVVAKNTMLILFSDGERWWDINLCACAPGQGVLQVDAGADQVLPPSATTVNLSATVTPGGTPSYTTQWQVVRKPQAANVTISAPTANNTSATNMIPGGYTFRVTVEDALGQTATDTVRVSVQIAASMFSSGGYADNVYDDSTGRRAWVYLPRGYDPEDTITYPVVIFLHGEGENGTDINDVLDIESGLPHFLNANAFEMESIVIMPQLTESYWTPPVIKKAYDYALAGYKVDADRVYATGFSTGGKGVADFVNVYPSLLAAYMPVSPMYNDLMQTGASVKNVPVMFVHGYQDDYMWVMNSLAPVNLMNSVSAKGTYPPLVKMFWDLGHGQPMWNKEVYDKRVAQMDFERDFFLMHSRNMVAAATKFVEQAEKFADYTQYAIAKKVVDKLPAGNDRTALQTRLGAKLTQLTSGQNYYIIDPGVNTYAEVTNTNKITSAAANAVKQNLVSILGAASTIDFTVISSSEPDMVDECPANDYLGLDHTIYRDGLKVIDTGASLKLSSLVAGAAYDLRIFYSDTSTSRYDRTGFWIAANGMRAETMEGGYNTTRYIDIFNVRPDAQGEIILTMAPLYGQYGIINAILVKEELIAPVDRKSRFNFSLGGAAVPGWLAMAGDPTVQVLSVTDENTGWMLTTVNTAHWQRYFTSCAADDDGMSTGTFSQEFPSSVVKGYFLNFNLMFDGDNYSLELKKSNGHGLDAGTYQVKIVSSVKSAVHNTGDGDLNVKFGSAPLQYQRLNPLNNTSQFRIFTGMVQAGETIKISVNRSFRNFSDIAFINGLIIEKVD